MTPTAPGDYSATLCDERHDRIDETLRTIGATLGTISTGVAALQTEVALVRVRMDHAQEQARQTGAWLRRALPWLIAALLGGGGTATMIRAAIQEPVPVVAPEADQ